jgi:hypothetical protein
VELQPEDAPGGPALIPRSPMGPNFSLSQGTASDDKMSAPGSFHIVFLGAGELVLPGYPKAPPLPASWRQVVGGPELTC